MYSLATFLSTAATPKHRVSVADDRAQLMYNSVLAHPKEAYGSLDGCQIRFDLNPLTVI